MIVTTPHQPDPEKYPGGQMLGLTIRGRRVGAGLTLRGCAELMGLTMADLSKVEQGQRPFTDQEQSRFNDAIAATAAITSEITSEHAASAWTCGMCKHVNGARNRSRCKRCGAVKGMGMRKAHE